MTVSKQASPQDRYPLTHYPTGLLTEEHIPLDVIQQDYIDEYYALSNEEKDEYIRLYTQFRSGQKIAPRVTSRGKIQDVTSTTRKMESLVSKSLRL
jgi:hypothetical protein